MITIALNTFSSFLRDKLIILFFILFACVVLLMMTPLLGLKAVTSAANASQMQSLVLSEIASIMVLITACGSMLAAWAAADTVASEMRSGTILAVMARPVHRWEFLAGKFLGVMLLMGVYVLMMLALSYLLAWMGGEKFQDVPWALVVYPLLRYAIYSAISMLLVTVIHPVLAFASVLAISVAATLIDPAQQYSTLFGTWVRNIVYVILPSTTLLSEQRFLVIKSATLNRTNWFEHLTAVGYGLDYAAVFLLLAMWSFHYRTLKRD